MKTYFESFDRGPGGWHTWLSNQKGPGALKITNGVVRFESPWWIDYNHAPPGGGYMNLTMGIRTLHPSPCAHDGEVDAVSGKRQLALCDLGTDFRGAQLTLTVRGELDLCGANLCLHVQARVGKIYVNYVLTGQPFCVTPQWSTQAITLVTDPSQWTSLGSRHDRMDFYGESSVEEVLKDINGNLILVLYPLTIQSEGKIADVDLHKLRAGEDYAVRQELLPKGWIEYDDVRILLLRNNRRNR